MNRKKLFFGIAALLLAGGLWIGRLSWRADETGHPRADSSGGPADAPGQVSPSDVPASSPLAPPDQTRRFLEFTPEQRVEFARKGSGPGG